MSTSSLKQSWIMNVSGNTIWIILVLFDGGSTGWVIFFSNIDLKYVGLLQIRNMRNMGNQLSLAALLMDKWDKQRNSFNNVCQLDSTFQHFLNVCQLCKYAFEPTSMQLIEIGLKSNRHNAVWMKKTKKKTMDNDSERAKHCSVVFEIVTRANCFRKSARLNLDPYHHTPLPKRGGVIMPKKWLDQLSRHQLNLTFDIE